MVRLRMTGKAPKQPKSALESKPFDYEVPPGEEDPNETYWRWRWNCEPILADYAAAKSFLDRHHHDYEGLSFVVHHFGDISKKTRLVCYDFDKAISPDGVLDPEVEAVVEMLDSYTEFSRSGRGLHVFIEVTNCPGFKNVGGAKIGGCKVDVLCSNAVAVTGKPFGEFRQVARIDWETFQALPFFIYKIPTDLHETRPEWWSSDPIDDVLPKHEFLIPQMQLVEAIEGQGGSKVLFAAACELARHGITGREAEPLLRCVPAKPAFSAKEIKRVIECAFNDVVGSEQFEIAGVENEFEVLEAPKPKERSYGFKPIPVKELAKMDLRIEWLAEGAITAEGSLFIGGREKCFKTAIAVDLLVSLATETPFLNKFPVPVSKRSVMFTAEIGLGRAQTSILSICKSKGVSMEHIDGMDIVDSVPSFAINPKTGDYDPQTKKALDGLQFYFEDYKPEIAIFDPLYFAMGGASVGDMYEIGRVLRKISEICKAHSVQPVFCHHARKNGDKEFKPMDLGDLYGSGVSAFARQWILLAHAEPFQGGVAQLYATIGGSSQGSRGLWRIEIDEGEPDDIMDRSWRVTVDESDGQRKIPEEALIDAFKASDEGTTGAYRASRQQLAVYLDLAAEDVSGALRSYMKSGKVTMSGNKYVWKGNE